MAHGWGSNTITIQGNGTIRLKHLGGEVRKIKCYCAIIIRMVSHMKTKISSLL
jgi:hypothetical protein